MAKILNKDPVTYQKERDGFLRELHHFHDGRGTPFRQVPRLHGHEVDLYLLYVLVTAHGGWEKVNQRAEWDVLLEQFSLPSSCVNGGIALKQIYIRYLERYERVHFMGEVGDQEEDAEDAHNRRWSVRAIHNVPLTYNHHHHNISDTVRSNVGLSTKLFKATEYDRLALSLLSPLPNEQDYAINVCTLLSNEGKHTLKLDRCPRLVDFLLAHAGVFAEASLRDVFMDMYKRAKNQSTRRFWADVIEEKDFLELTDPPPVKEFSNYCLPPTPSSLPDNLLDSESVLGELSKCIEELPDRTSPPSTKPPSVVPESENTDDCAMVDLSEVPSAEMPSEVQTDPPEPVVLDTSNRMDVADDEQTVEESKPDGEIKPEVVKPESEESEKPVEVEEVKVEKPKIRMIDVPEDEIPQLPKQESKSLFWCEPVDYSKLDALIDFGQFERDFLCLGRGLGVDDLLGQRVLQVATILRNLSFEEDNIPVLTKNLSFMRFALMCMQSKWNRLSQMGLDMLSQVAGEMVLEDPQTDTLAAMFLSTVTKGLSSPDRFMIISCLEIINKLSQNEVNEELMLKVIEQKVYDQVCTFLTLHDIMLLIYTLECLYSLSSLGEKACNSICRVHGAIDTLVSLITVEAQSYGPRACILMRVVERVPEQGGVIHPSSSSTVINTPTGAVQAPQLTQLTTMNATPAAQTTVITKQIITPQRPIQAMPQQSSGTTTIVIQAPSPQIAQQQQQQQIQENEQFVMAWLRTNYEIAVGATVDQNEIYHQYLAACSKVGKRGVPSFQFSRFVRTVFGGSVGPNPKPNAASGASQEYQYVGIKVAQRQQRLMQQQLQSGQQTTAPASASVSTTTKPVTKTADSTEQPVVIPKVNGTRGLLSPELQAENSMDTTDNLSKSNTLLPPPPPKSTKIDEDSNSAASTANSIISSGGGLSTDGDGDNSLTSFEGILLNGMPHNLDIDNESTEEIKPTNGNLEKPKAKGMLADLLEKKVATKEPIINGIIGKELRISEKGLELVENSLDDTNQSAEQTKQGLKRPAPTATPPQEAKKICLNGEVKAENETPEAKSEPENSSEVASTTENTATTTSAAITTQAPVLMAAPRQIIVAQGGIQPGQVVFTQASGMPMKTQVIVQQAGQRPMLVQNQQPMLINSTVGGGQQLLLTQNNGQTYVVAPSQGLSQGQTFLLAQNQQQGSNQKTIIILHQQGQKVGTPGQPMMVQLPRSAIQGGASGLQNLMFTQGSGGQMTVTLPGCNPIIARPVDPANGGAQQVIKVVTPARPATPASTSATVTTSAGVTANSTSASSTPTSTTTTTATPAPITVTLPVSPFVCEWRGCMRIFKSANEVYMHACQSHCPTGPEDVQCLWERCDNLKRKRFSLMTHLYDRHCNNETMKAMAVRRKQMAMSGKSEIPAPAPPPPHPGYAPNAALHAIKRHALEFVNPKELMQRTAAAGTAVASTATTSVTSSTPDAAPPPPSIKIGAAAPQVTQIIRPTQQPAETNPSRRLSFQDDNEGPVTKSIRLTSSLILRNLVIYSNTGKRHLRSYEPHLASIALSNVESSRTIAQVLYDMNQASNQS
ncbi:AT-rich interactive domain-containing protein 2 isoform X11 [Neocloeon triangulifer]|uniref:AT-rich interactive domain-containing protein 2 isoform X11 n=1 Tax=Neocloeon triangulifer TaxID=2078957 RepID=UPI00286F8275|nr:AT-rich interactive domain-containing protein 2 isoform X11 [Neocloeon triangulifer]